MAPRPVPGDGAAGPAFLERHHLYDHQLWASDGKPGEARVIARLEASGVEQIHEFPAEVAGRRFFALGLVGQLPHSLLVSDGKASGTRLVRDARGRELTLVTAVVRGGTTAWLLACVDSLDDCGIWTIAAQQFVATLRAPLQAVEAGGGEAVALGNSLFVCLGGDLWFYRQGGGAAKRLFQQSAEESMTLGPVAGERLFLVRRRGGPHPSEELLVARDGSASLEVVASFPNGSVMNPIEASGRAYFVAAAAGDRQQLWSSGGSRATTKRLTNLADAHAFDSGLVDSPDALEVVDGRVVFLLYDGLWATDDSSEGARRIRASCRGCFGPRLVAGANGRLVFVERRPTSDALWATDGTSAGTVRLLQPCSGCQDLHAVPGGAVFPRGARAIWRTDGTGAGTGAIVALDDPLSLGTVRGSKAFVLIDRGPHERREWASIDVPTGKVSAIRGFSPPSVEPYPDCGVRQIGDRIVFGASGAVWSKPVGGGSGVQLYSEFSTGCELTAAGGKLMRWEGAGLIAVDPSGAGSTPVLDTGFSSFPLTPYAGGVAFAYDGSLWHTNGTAAGTSRKLALLPGIDRREVDIGGLANELYFSTDSIGLENPLWRTDLVSPPTKVAESWDRWFYPSRGIFATPSGLLVSIYEGLAYVAADLQAAVRVDVPVVVESAVPFGDGAAVRSRPPSEDSIFQVSGTGVAERIWKGAGWHRAPRNLVSIGTKLCFAGAGEGSTLGVELWCSNGRAAGTRLIKDVAAGTASGVRGEALLAGGDRLYFTGWDLEHGHELWTSDGTAAGTRLLVDLVPGVDSSVAKPVAVAEGHLYFLADDGRSGRRIWRIRLDP